MASHPTGRNADPRRTIPLNSAAWRRLRAYVLRDEPLCRHCRRCGRYTPANVVDHISGDPSDNSRANLQSLCEPCHNRKTARGNDVPLPGCDARGIPADPLHGWRDLFD